MTTRQQKETQKQTALLDQLSGILPTTSVNRLPDAIRTAWDTKHRYGVRIFLDTCCEGNETASLRYRRLPMNTTLLLQAVLKTLYRQPYTISVVSEKYERNYQTHFRFIVYIFMKHLNAIHTFLSSFSRMRELQQTQLSMSDPRRSSFRISEEPPVSISQIDFCQTEHKMDIFYVDSRRHIEILSRSKINPVQWLRSKKQETERQQQILTEQLHSVYKQSMAQLRRRTGV